MGAEYCKQLSQIGFNIVLVSRTESKLKKVLSELDPKVKSLLVVADFSDSSNLEFYENIRQRCADLNVRIVIANAGILDANDVALADKLRLQHTVDVNAYHVALTTKILLPLIRDKKSALIVNSSSAWLHFFPRAASYAATKGFATYLTLGLAQELYQEGNVDVQCLCPFGTLTNIVQSPYFKYIATPVEKVI